MIVIDSSDSTTTDRSHETGQEKLDHSFIFEEVDSVEYERQITRTDIAKQSDLSQRRSRRRSGGKISKKEGDKRKLDLLRSTKPIKFDDDENSLYLSSCKSYNTSTSEEEKEKSEIESMISSQYKRERLKSLQACKDYLNRGRLLNRNVSGHRDDNSSLPSTVKFVPKYKKDYVESGNSDLTRRKLGKSNEENKYTDAINSRNENGRSVLSELDEKESLDEIMRFNSMTEQHAEKKEEEPNYTEFSPRKNNEKTFSRPLYVSMQENASDREEISQSFTDRAIIIPKQVRSGHHLKTSIGSSCVVSDELLAWEKENSVINVQLALSSWEDKEDTKGLLLSNSSIGESSDCEEMAGFAIRTRDLIAREKEIQKLNKEGHHDELSSSSRDQATSVANQSPTASLLIRKLQMLKNNESNARKEHSSNLNVHRSKSHRQLSDSKHTKVENVYSIILNPLSEMSCYLVESKSFVWSPSINECIRTYYNTGVIVVPEDCKGYDILLALDYFGIVYATHQLSFASFGCYIRLKAWRNYFNYRPEMANFVVKRLLSSKSRSSYTFFTSSVSSRKTIYFGKDYCELFEGGLTLDTENEDHIPHSCAVVNRCFNVYEDETPKNGTEIQTHETAELMRHDFSAYLRDMLPGTLVTFEIKHISPHPLLSSNNHSAGEEKSRNTYAVLNIIFNETEIPKTSNRVLSEKTELRNVSTGDKNKSKESKGLSSSKSNKKYSSENQLDSKQTSAISVKNKLTPNLQQLEIESRIYRTCDSNSMSSGTVESEDAAVNHPRSMLTTSNGKDREPLQNRYPKNTYSRVRANQRQHIDQSTAHSLSSSQLYEDAIKLPFVSWCDKSEHGLNEESTNLDEAKPQRLDEVNADWLRDVLHTEKSQCKTICNRYYDCAVDESNKDSLFFRSGNCEAGQ